MLLLIEPRYRTCPPYSVTLGPDVADLVDMTADENGPFRLDPEQRLLLNDWFALDGSGRHVAQDAVVVAPRQNLKTGALKAAVLGRLFVEQQRLVIWSSQLFSSSKEAFRDLLQMIESVPELAGEVKQVTTSAGSEGIEFAGGRRLLFRARSAHSARSMSADTVVLDEAYELTSDEMAALRPTLSARPDPQLLIGSSAGMTQSAVLRGYRDAGRVGAPDLAYAEWCADMHPCAIDGCTHAPGAPGCALDDKKLWWQANSALANGRMTERTIAAERVSMAANPARFSRERLGVWDDPAGAELGVDMTAWAECEDAQHQMAGEPFFALDVSPLRDVASIVAAGTGPDGVVHVEVTGRRGILDSRRGTGWILERLRELNEANPGFEIWVVDGSPAAALIPGIENAGIRVQTVPFRDVRRACAHFTDLLADRMLRHIGQPQLSQSAAAVVRKDSGDGFVWGRQKSEGDITALMAATVAAWLAQGGADYSISDSIM